MNPHLPIALAVTFLLAIVSTTACSEDEGNGNTMDPDQVAEAYCEATTDCFDDMDDEEFEDCVQELTDDYDFYESEFGTDCRDAVLETDHCLSRQDCDALREHTGCSAEFEREGQLCTHDNGD